jgi:very-short-patch-repair endonuclease
MSYLRVFDGGFPNQPLMELAHRQQGNVSVDQLHACGFTQSTIGNRCRQKRLFHTFSRVYSLGRPPSLPIEWAAAAVLAGGPGAALSHRSAFTLWGFAREWEFPLHVTCLTRRRIAGIVTHESQGLTRADIRSQLGIRTTSPARTLLDCAPQLPQRRLHRTAADARRSGLLHPAALLDTADRFPNHPGSKLLRAIVSELKNPTRSEFEDAFLVFCANHGLPTPLINTQVAGHEVDAFFPDHGLIVELDGWDFHRDRHAFEDDRDRDADALALGHPTVRVTWERMTGRGAREAQRLRRIMSARS